VHEIHDQVERAVFDEDDHGGDIVIHFDPCRETDCQRCAMPDCPIRGHELVAVEHFTTERATRPDSVPMPDLDVRARRQLVPDKPAKSPDRMESPDRTT
jgi:hypothetical protein